jgi:hypothetical protein
MRGCCAVTALAVRGSKSRPCIPASPLPTVALFSRLLSALPRARACHLQTPLVPQRPPNGTGNSLNIETNAVLSPILLESHFECLLGEKHASMNIPSF